jgi:hypothetical protein
VTTRDRIAATVIAVAVLCMTVGTVLFTVEWVSFPAAVGAGLAVYGLTTALVGLALSAEGEG